MANVHELDPPPRSGLKWECRWSWYDPKTNTRSQRRKRFLHKKEAEQHARDMENAAAGQSQSLDTQPGRITLTEWSERWIKSLEGKRKPSTVRGYQKILTSSVLPELGHRQVASLSTWDVEQFIDHLTATGKAAPTVKRHYGVLRGALQYAVKHKALAVNPCIGADLPADHRTDRKEPIALSPRQVKALAAALDPPYDLLVTFMAYTGLRAGEVAGLNIGDLTLLAKKPFLTVRRTRTKIKGGWEVGTPKNNKRRTVPLQPWLKDQLAAYLSTHPHRQDREHPLFPGRLANDQARFQHATGGIDWDKPWERDAFYKRQFKPALAAAKLPSTVRIHDLRHTAGSIMLSNGIPTYRVAQYLGHSRQVLETIYAHILDADAEQDMAAIADPALEA